MSWPLRWIINSVALAVVAWLLDGVRLSGPVATLAAAGLIGLLNAFIRPALLILTLPLNVMSLGLFTFVINGLTLLVASWLLPGFQVSGLGTAILAALLLSAISGLLGGALNSEKRDDTEIRATFLRTGPPDERERISPAEDKETIDLKKDEQGKWR